MPDKNTEAQPNVLLREVNLRRDREKNQDWNGKVRETMHPSSKWWFEGLDSCQSLISVQSASTIPSRNEGLARVRSLEIGRAHV